MKNFESYKYKINENCNVIVHENEIKKYQELSNCSMNHIQEKRLMMVRKEKRKKNIIVNNIFPEDLFRFSIWYGIFFHPKIQIVVFRTPRGFV